jgi:hypothetical protein
MATAFANYANDMSVNANFQALMGAINSNLVSFGWVYTSQSGDVDPSSASAPASGSYAGFRCYKSNDGLTDYYLRIDFGRRSGGSVAPMLKIQVGTTVNGSGTLGGQTSTARQISTFQSGAANTPAYFSGASGRFSCVIDSGGALDTANFLMAFSVGRTVDASGAATASGIEVFHTSNNGGPSTGWWSQYVPLTGTVPTGESLWQAIMMRTANPAVVGSNRMIAFPQTYGENGSNNPTLCVAGCDTTTTGIPHGSGVSVTVYGTTHVFLVFNLTNAIDNIASRAMIRYE